VNENVELVNISTYAWFMHDRDPYDYCDYCKKKKISSLFFSNEK